jgi:hypothetical protein
VNQPDQRGIDKDMSTIMGNQRKIHNSNSNFMILHLMSENMLKKMSKNHGLSSEGILVIVP